MLINFKPLKIHARSPVSGLAFGGEYKCRNKLALTSIHQEHSSSLWTFDKRRRMISFYTTGRRAVVPDKFKG